MTNERLEELEGESMTDAERTQLNIDLAVILGATWEGCVGGEVLIFRTEDCTRSLIYRWSDGSLQEKSFVRFEGSGLDFTSSIDAQAPLVKLVKERRLEGAWVDTMYDLLVPGSSPDRKKFDLKVFQGGLFYAFAHAPALIRAQTFLEVLGCQPGDGKGEA